MNRPELIEEPDLQAHAIEVLHENGETPLLHSVTAQTPWWIVSIMFHALIIVLAGLVSMAITMPNNNADVVVTVTMFDDAKKPEIKPVQTSSPDELNKPSPPTNIDEKNSQTNVVIPLNCEMIELSDRYRTDNGGTDPDGCQGDPSCQIYDPIGRIDESGGGGTDGAFAITESMIGVGPGSFGSGGGDGGGDGAGSGPGSGAGRGTIGTRSKGCRATRLKNGGGGPHTENAVAAALRWLAYHQETDGHWDSKKYGGLKVDTADTALALLTFLGAGHSEKVGPYADNIKRAILWLKSKQNASGLVYDTSDEGSHRGIGYPHAIATMALAEAAGMARVPETIAAAQKAVDYATEFHQQGEGSERMGFRYQAKQAGDLSVTGWFAMALKSAKVSGLKVNHAAFQGVLDFLEKVEQKNVASGDYGSASRFTYTVGGSSNSRLCAIGNLCRQFMGWKKDALQSSVELFVKEGGVPSWGVGGDSVDLYYWYYGSYCVFQQGGDLWKQWNVGMVKSLCENQSRQGDDAGSWEPKGPYSIDWGRVGQTALGALCLEVYYRYEAQLK